MNFCCCEWLLTAWLLLFGLVIVVVVNSCMLCLCLVSLFGGMAARVRAPLRTDCGDSTTHCRWGHDGDLKMGTDGIVRPKYLGSREHALFSWRGATRSPARRGAVLLHGAARTLVLPVVYGGLRHLIVDTLATHLGAPCDVFAAVSLYDDHTAVDKMNMGGHFMNRNTSRGMLVEALRQLVPRPEAATLSWRVLAFDCSPPTRRMDDACTRANKRAQFKHTPSMIIQATQIEAAFELLHAAAQGGVVMEYDWILRTRPDMQWVASPMWGSLLAERLPIIYSSHTLCTDCVLLLPSEKAEALLRPRSRVVCGFPDGSAFGGGGGGGRNRVSNELTWRHRGPRSACCDHFESFNTQCVFNGTAFTSANWPAILRRDALRQLIDGTETCRNLAHRTPSYFLPGGGARTRSGARGGSGAQRTPSVAEAHAECVRRVWSQGAWWRRRAWANGNSSEPTCVIPYVACAGQVGRACRRAGDRNGVLIDSEAAQFAAQHGGDGATPGCILISAAHVSA